MDAEMFPRLSRKILCISDATIILAEARLLQFGCICPSFRLFTSKAWLRLAMGCIGCRIHLAMRILG